jgi:acetolactate synthase-1/2/3 large subunit
MGFSVSKYSDEFMLWLKDEGYTHCFYLSGGNVMHLLESASQNFVCIPFVHEVGAGIAADYFNEIAIDGQRAFVLVTAGPGLTNVVTAIAGAWTDSRELLVIGGQAKVSDLSRGKYRQIGFQEIDGRTLCESITKASVTIDAQISRNQLHYYCELSRTGRKGPVFLEFCIDVSASVYSPSHLKDLEIALPKALGVPERDIGLLHELVEKSNRPIILIGGGVPRSYDFSALRTLGIPMATTFNGSDRVGIDYEFYCGRPNWYGSRWANMIIQQADLVIAVGTRLGLLQVGYNTNEFAPKAKIVHVDIDSSELTKGFPRVDLPIQSDSAMFLDALTDVFSAQKATNWSDWKTFIKSIREFWAKPDKSNSARSGYLEFHNFLFTLFNNASSNDIISPCSSGGTYTGVLQLLLNKDQQRIVTSHALASMGYGLPGAIGMAFAHPSRRVLALEGDGGFAQNLQELGVVKAHKLNLKMFISSNRGYASIRSSQRAYFNDHYIGCDESSGLGFPDWSMIFKSYDIPVIEVNPENAFGTEFTDLLNYEGPAAFVLRLDPEQAYFPRIGSRLNAKGEMESAPLHQMTPELSIQEVQKFLPYL